MHTDDFGKDSARYPSRITCGNTSITILNRFFLVNINFFQCNYKLLATQDLSIGQNGKFKPANKKLKLLKVVYPPWLNEKVLAHRTKKKNSRFCIEKNYARKRRVGTGLCNPRQFTMIEKASLNVSLL